VEGRRPASARLDDRGTLIRIVGIVLVRNEDLHVERAIRNIAGFCDRVHVADHMSTDGTWRIVRGLAQAYSQVDARRLGRSSDSHALVEGYAGTDTWVFGVDGDELYDPEGLARLGEELRAGAYADRFRLVGNVLNCVALDSRAGTATGYLSPPSRPVTKLYNFGAVDSWRGAHQRLHGGAIHFRPGYGERSVAEIGEATPWEQSPLRCLHVCFLPRSTKDSGHASERPNMSELEIDRRTRFPRLDDLAWAARGRSLPDGSRWKREKYRRGGLVETDVSAFLGLYVSA
jgi:hypothetical protein